MHGRPLYFTMILSFLEHTLGGYSTKVCHMLSGEPYWKVQGSHASWKVLDFKIKFLGPGNKFGPGKSCLI